MKAGVRTLWLVTWLVLACGCSSPPAPVEERSTRSTPARSAGQLSGGVYKVRRGETLYSIAFSYGLDWKDVAAWNGIRSPYTIYPGQDLRLVAPPARPRTASTGIDTRAAGKAPTATTRTVNPQTTPAPPPEPAPAPQQAAAPASQSPVQAGANTSSPAPASPTPAPPGGALQDPEGWLWPTDGRVISTYNASDPGRKGINISGREGQDIVASAAGDVVYSGNGLIGFGELIIVKHSDRMLTAYAHNQRRLVQEGQRVAAGQKIAEMGRNDQEEVMLHFELRVVGKPVDPLRYLPSR